MKMRTLVLALLVALGFLFVSDVQAQMGRRTMRGRDSKDQAFILEAASGGQMEVDLGKVATTNAASADVKAFGQRMVDDHTKANDQLKQIAQQKGVTVPTELKPRHQHTVERLSKLSGAAFDHAYMHTMVVDHREDVALFRHEASRGRDADVKKFAADTLPTLQEHLKMAEEIMAKLPRKGGGTKGGNGTTSGTTTLTK